MDVKSRDMEGGQEASTQSLRSAPPVRLRVPPRQLALFLDIDGTLAPITPRPEFTQVPVGTRRTLIELRRAGVEIAALSGRPLVQVRRLLLPVNIPAGGSHGAQLGPTAGRSLRFTGSLPPELVPFIQKGIQDLAGVWLERKPAALAIHWRQAPEYQGAIDNLASHALRLVPGWQLVCGHCVHELRPSGRNKGVALRWLMRQPGFRGRWPLAIGDDRTDEDAFSAALKLGGSAIRVGPTSKTLAPWQLPDVPALAGWLRGQLKGIKA